MVRTVPESMAGQVVDISDELALRLQSASEDAHELFWVLALSWLSSCVARVAGNIPEMYKVCLLAKEDKAQDYSRDNIGHSNYYVNLNE